jgi:hypothetical protein
MSQMASAMGAEAEILEGGSLYWVIKGLILCRQRIVDLQEVNLGDGIPRCALVLDQEIVRTEAAPRRAFQGWRYMDPACRRLRLRAAVRRSRPGLQSGRAPGEGARCASRPVRETSGLGAGEAALDPHRFR